MCEKERTDLKDDVGTGWVQRPGVEHMIQQLSMCEGNAPSGLLERRGLTLPPARRIHAQQIVELGSFKAFSGVPTYFLPTPT